MKQEIVTLTQESEENKHKKYLESVLSDLKQGKVYKLNPKTGKMEKQF
ncbi:MAG TPA: hypothetical protein VJB87_01690 [Candidatus Nanoarchaeia archaeon]|nr:hypothetical protein [Candidatus Nanoarchaeia archaeon]